MSKPTIDKKRPKFTIRRLHSLGPLPAKCAKCRAAAPDLVKVSKYYLCEKCFESWVRFTLCDEDIKAIERTPSPLWDRAFARFLRG